MPKTLFDDRAVDTTLEVAINDTDAAPNIDVADVTNWPVPAAGEEAIALVGFGTPTVEPIRYTGVDAGNGILTGTSRITVLKAAHVIGEKVVHGGDANFLGLLSRLDVAQTFTEDQTIENENHVLFGEGGGMVGRPGGLNASIYYMRNCRWDGANWVRRIADNDACQVALESTGDLIFYTNTDAGNTVGSVITWGEKFRITKAGNVTGAGYLWPQRAGGAGSGQLFLGPNGFVAFYVGNGSPEGVVTARVGSLYHREDGGAGTTLYVKESGVGNTGWKAIGAGMAIKSIQRGTITAPSNGSATATITAVDTAKSDISSLDGGNLRTGWSDMTLGGVRIALTNSTTVTATNDGIGIGVVVGYQVIEYQ